jgi:uncharacterized protein
MGKGLWSRHPDSPPIRVPFGCQTGEVDHDESVEVAGRAIDRARLAEICERYGIAELAVFGSVARGAEQTDSDIDLLYVTKPGARLGFAINRLEDELAEVFGRPVDLVARRALHPMIRDRIESEARPLHAA